MNDGTGGRLREEELAFLGRLGAEVSHEMRNVLSVIGEYAGLLDDLLALAGKKKSPDYARLRELAAKITGHVGKGSEVMERFSRFAHATDGQTAPFDLTALTDNMVALAQRRVTLAGCRLEAELPDGEIPVRANPFSLQHALFSALQLVLDSLERGELISMKLVAQRPAAAISISGNAAADDGLSARCSQLSAVMNELKGDVETSWAEGVLSLTLSIPTE